MEENKNQEQPKKDLNHLFIALVIIGFLAVGFLVGFLINQQHKELSREIDYLFENEDSDLLAVRAIGEKMQAAMKEIEEKNEMLQEQPWPTHTVYTNLQIAYPNGVHVVEEMQDLLTTKISMSPTPIQRVEGGSLDPVVITITMDDPEVIEGEEELLSTFKGGEYTKIVPPYEEGDVWFADRTYYRMTLNDEFGNEYTVTLLVLNQSEYAQVFDAERFMNGLQIIELETEEETPR